MTDTPMRLAVLTPSLTGQVHLEHSESMGDFRVKASLCLAGVMEAMENTNASAV